MTGNLHLGHVLTSTIQDVLIRFKNKQNIETLWIPGTDHAGIATQVVVEKILKKEFNQTRHELGREKFLEKVWQWKNEKGSSIKEDLVRLGTSFDWDREYFTMNENLSRSVNEAFVRLFEKGLIYRDKSLVNWSCSLESAISEIEVENVEIQGPTFIAVPNYSRNIKFGQIFEFAYKVADSEEEIVVSTTRPETLLGDVAVIVNPEDARYSKYHHRNINLVHPFKNELIPLIFDDYADPQFGTGAVKITPSHDKNDFLVAKRHNLPHCPVINEKGNVNESFEGFAGLPRFEAREKLLNSLSEKGLLRATKSHNMILPVCSRSKDIIEFLLRPQWFLKCDEMAARAVNAVKSGELKIIPQNFENEWFRWLENCRDWCISRQLWWGHQIPAYKVKSEDGRDFWVAARNLEEAKKKAEDKLKISNFSITQDQDVLDTWFSSGILPFSVFNWPENSQDLKKYFPLDLMETGHDILFFWVARMVMLSQELTGKLPFKEILLHGIICDAHGRKMSKSLGNVIVPEQVINGISLQNLQKETENSHKRGILSQSEMKISMEGQSKMFPNGIPECGTDALRFTLCSSNIKNHFITFDVQECYTNKLFFNKIWQATKYTIQSADSLNIKLKDANSLQGFELSDMDRWILCKLRDTSKTVENSLRDYNFHLATQSLKTFFYNNFCDVYLETTKKNILLKNRQGLGHCNVLAICLAKGLDLMECFTPFLSQQLQKHLPPNFEISLGEFEVVDLQKNVEEMLEICASIRQLKNEINITRKSNATGRLSDLF